MVFGIGGMHPHKLCYGGLKATHLVVAKGEVQSGLYDLRGLLKRKRRVAVVRDAIETLAPEVGNQTLAELQSLGAKLVTTDEILDKLTQTRA